MVVGIWWGGPLVVTKEVDDALGRNVVALEREAEVEEVAALLALVERAKLGAEQLVKGVGRQRRDAGEPARGHLESLIREPVHAEVLARVDSTFSLSGTGGTSSDSKR